MGGNRGSWHLRPLLTRRRVTVLGVVGVVIVIAVFVVGFLLPSPYTTAHQSAEAVNQCQMAVANQLSTPADATFSSQANLMPDGWHVAGSVVYSNAAEVVTSTSFRCTVREHSRTDDTTIDWIG